MHKHVHINVAVVIAAIASSSVAYGIWLRDVTGSRQSDIPAFLREYKHQPLAFVASAKPRLFYGKHDTRRFAEKDELPSDFNLTPRDRVVISRDPFAPRPYLWDVRWPETERKIELRAIKYDVGQIWSPDGYVETVTALKVLPCSICEFMDFGYALVAYGKPSWERRWNLRTELGKLVKNCSNFAYMKPVKLQPPQDYVLGQILDVSAFAGCTHVRVTGITKGKGFAGVIKRYGFARCV
ncbi:50S ribosomal protein L3 [Babesia ovis]|uniref:50S ribosomal protein L3 n=1 Tax=Babesia ovis TaxID=5869 RepID=A0A9W5TE50_BABOV|nr:50S ribosomal protein L3 [Babesia ovis]